jgi:hypothetical protein
MSRAISRRRQNPWCGAMFRRTGSRRRGGFLRDDLGGGHAASEPGHGQARPGDPEAPAGDDVGRPMHAEIDPAEADQDDHHPGQHHAEPGDVVASSREADKARNAEQVTAERNACPLGKLAVKVSAACSTMSGRSRPIRILSSVLVSVAARMLRARPTPRRRWSHSHKRQARGDRHEAEPDEAAERGQVAHRLAQPGRAQRRREVIGLAQEQDELGIERKAAARGDEGGKSDEGEGGSDRNEDAGLE